MILWHLLYVQNVKKNDVSEYAESCPNCGFPIKQYLSDHNFTNCNNALICPNCLEVYANPGHINTICEYCQTTMVQTETDADEYITESLKYIWVSDESIKHDKELEQRLMKEANITSFSQEAYDQRKEKIRRKYSANKTSTSSASTKTTNTPKCPTCGSTNITAGQRGYSFWTGFLGSNKTVNRCSNCGHTWKP